MFSSPPLPLFLLSLLTLPPREASFETRSTPFARRRTSSLPSIYNSRSRFAMSSKIPSRRSSPVKLNIVKDIKLRSRNNSRQSRRRKATSTRLARNTSKIVSALMPTLRRAPSSRARISSAFPSNSNVPSRRSTQTNANSPTLPARYKIPSPNGSRNGNSSATAAKILRRSVWNSQRTTSGRTPTPSPSFAFLMTR